MANSKKNTTSKRNAASTSKHNAKNLHLVTNYDGKKIKVVNKNITDVREGTWRRTFLEAIMRSKTTDEAQKKINASKKFHGRRCDFGYAVKHGFIKVA
jgi:hypothetical protein